MLTLFCLLLHLSNSLRCNERNRVALFCKFCLELECLYLERKQRALGFPASFVIIIYTGQILYFFSTLVLQSIAVAVERRRYGSEK